MHELERRIASNRELVSLWSPLAPVIRCIPVPAFAPTSATQAAQWSESFWPTIYKNTNPYGPHPAIVRRAELEILEENGESGAEHFMELAKRVGQECKDLGFGNGAGAVVVARIAPILEGNTTSHTDKDKAVEITGQSKVPKVVAVAGDFRFAGWLGCEQVTDLEASTNNTAERCSNVMGHSILRVISFVARKRREVAGSKPMICTIRSDLNPASDTLNPFVDSPMTPLEKHYLTQQSLTPNGYLCLDLEIYTTHEPCVMCSMAMLHSRFGRIIFESPSAGKGALSSENLSNSRGVEQNSAAESLGYGLFWRLELNWRCFCWQYKGGALDPTNDAIATTPNGPDDTVQA